MLDLYLRGKQHKAIAVVAIIQQETESDKNITEQKVGLLKEVALKF